jgi:hypothetical protein
MASHIIDSKFGNQVRVPADILEGIFESNDVHRCYQNDGGQVVWTYIDSLGKRQTIISSVYSEADVQAIEAGQRRRRYAAEDAAREAAPMR